MSWPHLGVVRVVTVFDTNENRGKECEGLGKITERKGFENQFLTITVYLARKIMKEPKRCTKDVPDQYICSVLGVFLQCIVFWKIGGNSGDTASTCQENCKTWNI